MAEKIQFFLLDINYKVIDDIPTVFLYGKTIENKQICIIDKSFKPYFYVILNNEDDLSIFQEKIKKIEVEQDDYTAKVVDSEIVEKSFLGKKVKIVKIFVKIPKDVPIIRNTIKDWEMIKSINEYDVHFARRYLIDKQIIPLNLIEVEGDFINLKSRVPVFEASSISSDGETLKNPKIMAFDIETYNPLGKRFIPEEHPIIMIAFYGENYKKVITWKKFKTEDKDIEFVNGEADLINRFKEIIEEQKPDIITGYYSDGFDFPYLITRAKKYKISLDIGLDFTPLSITKGRTKNIHIVGITHLDIFRFISKNLSRSLETDNYDLDSVAAELLDENKHSVDLDILTTVWDTKPEELEKYCHYNLKDAELTYKLALKLFPQINELVKIVGLPVYDVTRMAFSQLVEWFILRRVQEFNELAPSKPGYEEISQRRSLTYKGGFVFEPIPGLYKNIAVFDFRSLYPSIISSHNIGLDTFNCTCCRNTADMVPDEKYWFCKEKRGFIPKLVEELITRRLRVKEMIKEKPDVMLDARSESLKLLSNSFYGYLGFYASRWYCMECAQSITAYGRYYINKVISKAEEKQFKVLYADSITKDRFIVLLDKEGIVHIKNVEDFFKEHIKKTKKIADKEIIYFDNYSSLTVNPETKKVGWEKLKSIIRHKNTKKIFRVNQKYGETRVTEDHSIISSDGKKFIELKPTQISDKNHFVKIVKIPTLKEINKIDIYETLKDYNYTIKYKNRIKTATVHADNNWVWFGWTNRKVPVKIKRFINVGSEDFNALCRLLGTYIPEGSSSTPETTNSRLGASISTSNVKLLEELQKDYHRLFTNVKTSVIRSQKNKRILEYTNNKGLFKKIFYEDKTSKLQMMNILSAVFFKMFCGQKSSGKKLPWFIYHIDDKYKKIILQKMIEGDGSRSVNKNLNYSEEYKKNFFRYTTKSLELISGLSFLLSQLNQKYSTRYRQSKRSYTITTSSRFNKKFKTKITEEKYKGYVYDLEIENTHIFIDACGQILLHNTDSIFLSLEGKSKEDALSFVEKINKTLPEMMELEHEGFYPSGIFVSAKEGPYGAKKRYALLDDEGLIKIKGFETVRRNVSFIAKDVQGEVLNIILKEDNPEKAVKYVRKVIQKLRDKEIDNSKVVIFTQISKNLEEYDSVGPHVAVAKMLKAKGVDIGPGSLIKFIITQGSGILRDRARVPEDINQGDYDAEYYIKNQVIPSVEKIFEVLGFSKNDLLESKDQSKLGSFF